MASRRMSGRSPLSPDRNHFHHRLAHLFGARTARWVYVGLVASASGVATFEPRLDTVCLAVLAVAYVLLPRPDLVGWRPKTLPAPKTVLSAIKQDVSIAASPSIEGRQIYVPPSLQPQHDGNRTLQ